MKHCFIFYAGGLLTLALPAVAQTSGNIGVGIGITTPTQTLDVNGGLLVRGYRAASYQGAYLHWNRTNGDGATWLLNQGLAGGAGGIRFGSVTTGDVVTEWARFDANGRLGIGTASPAHPLVVQANADNRLLGFSDANGTDKYNFSRQVATNTVPGGLNLSESNTAGGRLFIQDGSGSVGVGTTTPAKTLDVVGSLGLRNSAAWDHLYFNHDGTTAYLNAGGADAGLALRIGNSAYGSYDGQTYNEIMRLLPGGNVGIGTATPTALLDVNGSARLRGLTTAGIVTTDATGKLSSTSAASLDVITASNGLTRSGNDIRLGGPLTQNTDLTLAGHALSLLGGATGSRQISQLAINVSLGSGSGSGSLGWGQSFGLPAGATITKIDVYLNGGSGTFSLWQGAPGNGSALASQTVSYAGASAVTSIVFTNPITISAAGTYSFSTGTNNPVNMGNNQYADGNAYSDTYAFSSYDLKFVVYYTGSLPALYASSGGQVGLNTDSPTALLDVAGTARVRGLGAGVVQAAADGTLSSSSATTAFGASFIQNSSAQQANSSFNISGNGTVGGTLTATQLLATPSSDADLGLRVTDGANGNITLQPLTNSNSGFAFLGFNGGYNGGEVRYNTSKNRWRLGVEQRGNSDSFFLDTYNGTTSTLLLAGTTAGYVGVGTNAPVTGLHVTAGNSGPGTGGATGGALLSGAPGTPPYLELRGSGTGTNTTTPYLDFAETNDVDYSTRLISQGGVLTLNTTKTSGNVFVVRGAAGATAFNTTSDQRLKTDVRPLNNALSSVLALRGVRYHWNALGVQRGGQAGTEQVGLLAQELEKVYPELVATDAQGYKSVNYAQLAPVLIEALKEQQAQIESLKAYNAAATQRADRAEASLDSFEQRLRAIEAGGAQAQANK